MDATLKRLLPSEAEVATSLLRERKRQEGMCRLDLSLLIRALDPALVTKAIEALRTVNQLSSISGLASGVIGFGRLIERRMARRE